MTRRFALLAAQLCLTFGLSVAAPAAFAQKPAAILIQSQTFAEFESLVKDVSQHFDPYNKRQVSDSLQKIRNFGALTPNVLEALCGFISAYVLVDLLRRETPPPSSYALASKALNDFAHGLYEQISTKKLAFQEVTFSDASIAKISEKLASESEDFMTYQLALRQYIQSVLMGRANDSMTNLDRLLLDITTGWAMYMPAALAIHHWLELRSNVVLFRGRKIRAAEQSIKLLIEIINRLESDASSPGLAAASSSSIIVAAASVQALSSEDAPELSQKEGTATHKRDRDAKAPETRPARGYTNEAEPAPPKLLLEQLENAPAPVPQLNLPSTTRDTASSLASPTSPQQRTPKRRLALRLFGLSTPRSSRIVTSEGSGSSM